MFIAITIILIVIFYNFIIEKNSLVLLVAFCSDLSREKNNKSRTPPIKRCGYARSRVVARADRESSTVNAGQLKAALFVLQ